MTETRTCRMCGLEHTRAERIELVEHDLMEVVHGHDDNDIPLEDQFEAVTNVLLDVANQFEFRADVAGMDQGVLARLGDMIRTKLT